MSLEIDRNGRGVLDATEGLRLLAGASMGLLGISSVAPPTLLPLNYRRSFLRRLSREFASARWFDPSPGETPAERAAMRCLEGLPPDQREVIVLKIWHGHTFEEIASLLDLSPNTAAGRYRYGMNKLRTCLHEQGRTELHELDQSLGTATRILDPA